MHEVSMVHILISGRHREDYYKFENHKECLKIVDELEKTIFVGLQ